MADAKLDNAARINRNGAGAATDDIQAWRKQLVQGALRVLAVVGLLAVIAGSYSDYANRGGGTIPVYVAAYLVLAAITFWPRAPYVLQAGTILLLVYALGAMQIASSGLAGDEGLFLLTSAALAGLFFGRRVGFAVLGLVVVTLLLGGWAFSTGQFVVTPEKFVRSNTSFASWASTATVFLMLAALLTISENVLFTRLSDSLTGTREMARQVEAARADLQARVEERTHELAQRNTYLEATAQVTREIVGTLEVRELLARVVNVVSERFGFYHTGIFLMDASGEWVELQAASSAGGQRLLERGHRLRVEDRGVVGTAASRGQARISLDTDADAAFLQNPDLPDTRSEIALPLRARGQTMGVLDVQSTLPQAFGPEDVAILQTLTDQVALAISNARLFEQSQASLEAERRAYGELSRQGWERIMRTRTELGFVSDQQGTTPTGLALEPQMQQALHTGQATLADDHQDTLAIPIKIRGQAVGVVDVQRPGDAGAWTPDQIAMLQTLSDQLGVALEGARLYEDSQRRAIQERLVGEITARMRESLDMETVLKTAADQIWGTLGMSKVTVRLVSEEK